MFLVLLWLLLSLVGLLSPPSAGAGLMLSMVVLHAANVCSYACQFCAFSKGKVRTNGNHIDRPQASWN